jgi:hypothetical protein
MLLLVIESWCYYKFTIVVTTILSDKFNLLNQKHRLVDLDKSCEGGIESESVSHFFLNQCLKLGRYLLLLLVANDNLMNAMQH